MHCAKIACVESIPLFYSAGVPVAFFLYPLVGEDRKEHTNGWQCETVSLVHPSLNHIPVCRGILQRYFH
jgi:hypothetical protein